MRCSASSSRAWSDGDTSDRLALSRPCQQACQNMYIPTGPMWSSNAVNRRNNKGFATSRVGVAAAFCATLMVTVFSNEKVADEKATCHVGVHLHRVSAAHPHLCIRQRLCPTNFHRSNRNLCFCSSSKCQTPGRRHHADSGTQKHSIAAAVHMREAWLQVEFFVGAWQYARDAPPSLGC